MHDSEAHDIRVRIDSGVVQGARVGDLARFLGIPFAASPFGARRFRFPEPVEPWDGARPAIEPGDGAPQNLDPNDPLDNYFNPGRIGEDCLNLNVWSPDVTASGLPVMVWIHGGGYVSGGSSAPAYDGATFARDGVVFVSLNYRVGLDGFAFLGDGTDNLGLRDQVAALEWVRRNIAAFGGDPDEVTIFGESGGAVSVLTLMAMPSARGLFARAISESGSPRVSASVASATAVTDRVAELIGIDADRESFAALPLDRSIAAAGVAALDWWDTGRWGADSFTISPFRAVHGTESLPEPVFEAASRSSVPLLAGTVRNETVSFAVALGLDDPAAFDRMLGVLGVEEGLVASYRAGRGLSTPFALAEAIWTDWAFRMPTLSLVDARRNAPSFVSELRWQSPLLPDGFGAGHGVDVPFVFDGLPAAHLLVGGDAPAELATRMHRAWVDFATTGDPGWSRYDEPARTTMVFDTVSRTVDDAAAPERQAWAGLR